MPMPLMLRFRHDYAATPCRCLRRVRPSHVYFDAATPLPMPPLLPRAAAAFAEMLRCQLMICCLMPAAALLTLFYAASALP